MFHLPWSEFCRFKQREPAVGEHWRQVADLPKSPYFLHQLTLGSTLTLRQAQATVFEQVIVTHTTQVLQKEGNCLACTLAANNRNKITVGIKIYVKRSLTMSWYNKGNIIYTTLQATNCTNCGI